MIKTKIPKITSYYSARALSLLMLMVETLMGLLFYSESHLYSVEGFILAVLFVAWPLSHLVFTIFFIFRKPWSSLALIAACLPNFCFVGWALVVSVMGHSIGGGLVAFIVIMLMIYYVELLWTCHCDSKNDAEPVRGFEPIMKPKDGDK